jgi:hypothetical protein
LTLKNKAQMHQRAYDDLQNALFRWPMKEATRSAIHRILQECRDAALPAPEHELSFEEEVDADEVYLSWNCSENTSGYLQRAGVFVDQKGALRGHRLGTALSIAEATTFVPLDVGGVVDFVQRVYQQVET